MGNEKGQLWPPDGCHLKATHHKSQKNNQWVFREVFQFP